MFNPLNFPTAEQIDIQNALLASIASNLRRYAGKGHVVYSS
jgi:hypothetical protein